MLPKLFDHLAESIANAHKQLQFEAASAVNKLLTLRNWLIGYYIVEYEQNGEDRAEYGDGLMDRLALELADKGLKNTSAPELRRYRKFYDTYPVLGLVFQDARIRGTVSHELRLPDFNAAQPNIMQTPSASFEIEQLNLLQTLSAQLKPNEIQKRGTPSHELEIAHFERVWARLSFSHLVELIKIDDPQKRLFYELQAIKGTWSVREMKRQISSLYYERSGLSANPLALAEMQAVKDQLQPNNFLNDWIKNPMVFEFLDLPHKEVVLERDIENALLNNLKDFLLELGNGFCFEARQKRILIDDTYFFIDLVFYHRILKCHVLIELKAEAFTHENAGQLDVYLQYYKNEEMEKGDNPPIGILLCTDNKETMVKYATANKENLLVSNYQVNLPSKEQLEAFIRAELNKKDRNEKL